MPRKVQTLTPEKQLEIKTKIVQRLVKEVTYYHKEVKENEEKLAKMKADNADFHDIKKFQEVLDESNMMIPDSQTRLKKSVDELSTFLSETNTDTMAESEWLRIAKDFVTEHSSS